MRSCPWLQIVAWVEMLPRDGPEPEPGVPSVAPAPVTGSGESRSWLGGRRQDTTMKWYIVQRSSTLARPVVIWLDNCVVCNCELTPLCQGRALQYWRLTQVPTLHINSHSLTLYRHKHRQITGRLRPAMNRETNGNGITFNQRSRRRLAEKENPIFGSARSSVRSFIRFKLVYSSQSSSFWFRASRCSL